MAHSHLSHHDPNSLNYDAHVVELKKIDYCLGCLGSRIFLVFILPLLFYGFIYPNSLFYTTLDFLIFTSLWLVVTSHFSYEIYKGREVHSKLLKLISDIYIYSSILYVILVPSNLPSNLQYLLILLLSGPQIGLYLYKSISKDEFHYKATKLSVRLLFISALFFVLNGLNLRMGLFSFILIFGAILFLRLRSFSDMRVNDNKFLFSALPLSENTRISGLLWNSGVFDARGNIKDLHEDTGLFKKLFVFSFLGILYIVGLIVVSSNAPTLMACTTAVSKTPLALAPWIVLKTSNQKFCSNCGQAAPIENSFCEECGTKFTLPASNNQNINQNVVQGQTQGYQDSRAFGRTSSFDPRYGDQGYYPSGRRGHSGTRRNDQGKSIPIGAGVVVGVIVLLVTGSVVLALILGVVAGFGVMLAMSTNNPCLSYCIISSCIDCICSVTGDGRRRRGGKF